MSPTPYCTAVLTLAIGLLTSSTAMAQAPFDITDATSREVQIALEDSDPNDDPATLDPDATGVWTDLWVGNWTSDGSTGTITVPGADVETFWALVGFNPAPGTWTDLVFTVDIASGNASHITSGVDQNEGSSGWSGRMDPGPYCNLPIVDPNNPFQMPGTVSGYEEVTIPGTGTFQVLCTDQANFTGAGTGCGSGGDPFVFIPSEPFDPSTGRVNFADCLWFGSAPLFSVLGELRFTEVFADADGDSIDDAVDNCLGVFNPSQADNGGLNDPNANGVGDACECGDVNANGQVQINDATIIKRAILGLGPGIADPGKCNVIGLTDATLTDPTLGVTADCLINDATIVKRAILGLGPGISPGCVGQPEP